LGDRDSVKSPVGQNVRAREEMKICDAGPKEVENSGFPVVREVAFAKELDET